MFSDVANVPWGQSHPTENHCSSANWVPSHSGHTIKITVSVPLIIFYFTLLPFFLEFPSFLLPSPASFLSSQMSLISAYVSLLLQGPIQMLSPLCFSNFIKLSVLWIPIALYVYSSFLTQSTFFHIVQLFKSMCISSDCKFHESLWYNLLFGSSYSHTFLT